MEASREQQEDPLFAAGIGPSRDETTLSRFHTPLPLNGGLYDSFIR
jgi:hypothetical protein